MTDDRKQNEKDRFDQFLRDDPVPDFETAWRRARLEVGAGRRSSPARWILGPAVAAAGCAIVVAILTITSTGNAPSPEMLAILGELGEPDAGTFMLDQLLEDEEETREKAEEIGDGSEEAVASADEAYLTGELFEGETDFLLTMEIASFQKDGERNI